MNVESTCIFISGSYDANCVCSDHAEMYITILIPSFPYGPIKKSYRILFKKWPNWEHTAICHHSLLSIDRSCTDFTTCDH